MKQFSSTLRKFILLGMLFGLLLTLVSTLTFAPADAQTLDADDIWMFSAEIADLETRADDCIIPPSGPWPPCATGGNNNGDDCVIPPSGPWPPCATGGDGGGNQPAPGNGQGQPCPPSGVWPPGCVPNGGGGNGSSGGSGDCVIPESGPWPPCATNGSGNSGGIEGRLNTGLQQLDAYWHGELTWRGITPPVLQRFELYEGDPDDPPNAFYVPDQDAIFIDIRLLEFYVNEYGEFAAVTVLAHEYSHFIQDALGLLVRSTPVRTIELQADCLTGSFTGYLRDTGALRPGEYEIGGQMLFAVGDDQLSPDGNVPIWVAHGTGEERRASYDLGYFGTAQTCFEANY